jgi:hypothetical protein
MTRSQGDYILDYNEQTQLVREFTNLASLICENKVSDVSEAPPFSGRIEDWDTWYQQFRTYLKAKGWLDIYLYLQDHQVQDFDVEINSKIYNKLTILCGKGNTFTYYVQAAAEFDGHGTGQKFFARYAGFSKQRNDVLRKLISTMRHTAGTSIVDHTDLF